MTGRGLAFSRRMMKQTKASALVDDSDDVIEIRAKSTATPLLSTSVWQLPLTARVKGWLKAMS